MLPALTRLAAIADLSDADIALLALLMRDGKRVAARREFVTEGEAIRQPTVLLEGWAASVRYFADGHRQIVNFLLPGEVLGLCTRRNPVAPATMIALTEIRTVHLPSVVDLPPGSKIAEAYATSRALDELSLRNQVVRLGRMGACERIVDLLLELHGRFDLAGLAVDRSFSFPLTQETVADALGLTSVHVNRMMQVLRRERLLTLKGGIATLAEASELANRVNRRQRRSLLDQITQMQIGLEEEPRLGGLARAAAD